MATKNEQAALHRRAHAHAALEDARRHLRDEWICPRCGLCGDHHKTGDPSRCQSCCTTDAAPDLLAACEAAYTLLADIRHEWLGRATIGGQALLCDLRDSIAKARGVESQTVQDHAGARP